MKLVMVCVEPDKLRATLVTWYKNRICCLLYRRKDQHKRDPRPLLLFFQKQFGKNRDCTLRIDKKTLNRK